MGTCAIARTALSCNIAIITAAAYLRQHAVDLDVLRHAPARHPVPGILTTVRVHLVGGLLRYLRVPLQNDDLRCVSQLMSGWLQGTHSRCCAVTT